MVCTCSRWSLRRCVVASTPFKPICNLPPPYFVTILIYYIKDTTKTAMGSTCALLHQSHHDDQHLLRLQTILFLLIFAYLFNFISTQHFLSWLRAEEPVCLCFPASFFPFYRRCIICQTAQQHTLRITFGKLFAMPWAVIAKMMMDFLQFLLVAKNRTAFPAVCCTILHSMSPKFQVHRISFKMEFGCHQICTKKKHFSFHF